MNRKTEGNEHKKGSRFRTEGCLLGPGHKGTGQTHSETNERGEAENGM